MITLEKPAASSAKVFAIREASYVAPYQLRLTFTDGQKSLVDFEPFLRASRHPAIQAYLDKRKFRAFTVEDGFLHWNDFELVFPMADLHAGRIS
jgi:hypothetical protein